MADSLAPLHDKPQNWGKAMSSSAGVRLGEGNGGEDTRLSADLSKTGGDSASVARTTPGRAKQDDLGVGGWTPLSLNQMAQPQPADRGQFIMFSSL